MVIVSLYLNSIHKLFREWNFADGICLFLGFISMVVSDGLQGQNETLIYFKTTDRAHITKKTFWPVLCMERRRAFLLANWSSSWGPIEWGMLILNQSWQQSLLLSMVFCPKKCCYEHSATLASYEWNDVTKHMDSIFYYFKLTWC